MSIYEYDEEKHMQQIFAEGMEKGLVEGIERGINVLITTCRELGLSEEAILTKVMDKFSLSKEQAEKYVSERNIVEKSRTCD